MPLERMPDGTHVYTPPQNVDTARRDPQGRTASINAPVPPLQPPAISPVTHFKETIWKGYEGGEFFYRWSDPRAGFANDGPLNEVAHAWKRNDLQGVRPDVACLPFTQATQTTSAPTNAPGPTPTQNVGRMSWQYFQGHVFAVMCEFGGGVVEQLYEENATTGLWVEQAAFNPSGANAGTRVLAVVRLASTDYLAVGYDTGSIDFIADPHGAAGVSVAQAGFLQVYDMIQSPDGSLLVYGQSASGIGLHIAPNAAAGALVFTLMIPIFPGGYCIGDVALANYTPGVYWWVPDSGSTNATFVASENGASQDATPKGHIVRTSYDLLTLEPVDFPGLPWVSIATKFQNSIVACDRTQHFIYYGRGMAPIDWSVDRPADSNKDRRCCGHYDMHDRFGWVDNIIDRRWTASGATHITANLTKLEFMTYDFYLRTVHQLGLTADSDWGGISTTVGGLPSLPYSDLTGNMQMFNIAKGAGAGDNGFWYRLYNPPPSVDAFARRKTSGAAAGTGAEYFGYGVYQSATFYHQDLGPGWEYALVRVVGPSSADIREGGWDSRMDIWPEGYGHGTVDPPPGSVVPPIRFRGRETTAGGVVWEAEALTWTTQPSWYMVVYQGTIDSTGAALTDPTHMTPNVAPIQFEYLVRRPVSKGARLR